MFLFYRFCFQSFLLDNIILQHSYELPVLLNHFIKLSNVKNRYFLKKFYISHMIFLYSWFLDKPQLFFRYDRLLNNIVLKLNYKNLNKDKFYRLSIFSRGFVIKQSSLFSLLSSSFFFFRTFCYYSKLFLFDFFSFYRKYPPILTNSLSLLKSMNCFLSYYFFFDPRVMNLKQLGDLSSNWFGLYLKWLPLYYECHFDLYIFFLTGFHYSFLPFLTFILYFYMKMYLYYLYKDLNFL